jgi:hypothetical protein
MSRSASVDLDHWIYLSRLFGRECLVRPSVLTSLRRVQHRLSRSAPQTNERLWVGQLQARRIRPPSMEQNRSNQVSFLYPH